MNNNREKKNLQIIITPEYEQNSVKFKPSKLNAKI